MPRCRFCATIYKPARSMQPGRVCNDPECQAKFALEDIDKKRKQRQAAERIAAREDRKTIKIKLDKLKTPGQRSKDLMQEAEKAVRDYRRTYELMIGSGCISCARTQQEVIGSDGWKPGGAFDAGHYHGKGARPGLRLTPDNIWLQCKSCNGGSAKYARKGATVAKQFRENLIQRIGIERVEELDADDKPRHYTDDQLIEIRDTYRAKLKELKNAKNS